MSFLVMENLRVEGKGVIAVQSRFDKQKFIHDVLYVPNLAMIPIYCKKIKIEVELLKFLSDRVLLHC